MYREYHDIFMFNKVRTKVEVMLGISEDKIEVYPKLPYSSKKFWKRQKSFSNNMEGIVACDIVEKKENGKWIFRCFCHIYFKKNYR